MTDSRAGNDSAPDVPVSISSIVDGLPPMGDLSRFKIEDLEPDEEERFFEALKNS